MAICPMVTPCAATIDVPVPVPLVLGPAPLVLGPAPLVLGPAPLVPLPPAPFPLVPAPVLGCAKEIAWPLVELVGLW